jgi:hypothetical protein
MINKMPCLKSHASQRVVWGVGRKMVKKNQHVAKKILVQDQLPSDRGSIKRRLFKLYSS